MKRLLSFTFACVIAFALTVATSACNRNNTTNTNTDNDAKARVDKALDNANLKDVHTNWDKDANVVHLTGTVKTPADKERADQVAEGAVGTSGRVLDELKVEGMDEKPVSDVDKTIGDTLKSRINDDQVLRDRTIHFDVNQGVVTVTGNVRTAAEKAKVSELVRSTNGVKQMANELKVEPKK